MQSPGDVCAVPLSYNSAVGEGGFLPEGEALRRAIAWLASREDRSLPALEEASQRFGLSPLDSAVLYRYFSPDGKSNYISVT
jgi:hypothetical protein